MNCSHRNGNITGYSVRYRVQEYESTQTESVSGGATTHATIPGLTPSTSYVIEIAAVNSAGIGVYSDPLTVEILATSEPTVNLFTYRLCCYGFTYHTCTPSGAFIRFMGMDLPNHGYVNLTTVGDTRNGSDSVQCHTDLRTCCNRDAGPDRGDWYFPNGTRLPVPRTTFNIFESRVAQQVKLLHRGRSDVTSGIYCCTIETNAVHNDSGRETVYAGLYASGGEEDMKCSSTE